MGNPETPKTNTPHKNKKQLARQDKIIIHRTETENCGEKLRNWRSEELKYKKTGMGFGMKWWVLLEYLLLLVNLVNSKRENKRIKGKSKWVSESVSESFLYHHYYYYYYTLLLQLLLRTASYLYYYYYHHHITIAIINTNNVYKYCYVIYVIRMFCITFMDKI